MRLESGAGGRCEEHSSFWDWPYSLRLRSRGHGGKGQAPAPNLPRPDASLRSSPRRFRPARPTRTHGAIAPGIVGSGVGVTPSGQPVIEVFTTRPGVSVPETLGGVPVRTVVTGMIVARSATLRYPRPVPIGVSTGLADFATGTLGARVSNGPAVYALSNNHVFAGRQHGEHR